MAQEQKPQNSETPNQPEPQTSSTAGEELYERTAGIRQGDPDEARYFGPANLPDSGFGTGQTDYGGSTYGIGATPGNNYHPGYGLVPGYGALGTQGSQGVDDQPTPNQPQLPRRDARIRQDVLLRLAQQPELTNFVLEVEVVNAIVTVRGCVATSELKRLVYAQIEPMREVRDIINQVEIV